MKLIDREGKLFGVINLLDLFLILLLLGAGAFAAMKFLSTDTGTVSFGGGEQVEVTYVLFNSNEFAFVTDRIKPGEKIKSANTNVVIGEVIDVKIDQATAYVTTAEGHMVISPVPEKNEVYVTLKTTATLSGGNATAGGEQLLVGNRIKVKGPDFLMEMIISSVDLSESK